jgi:dTDP-4-dehydrorhamnose 3,5-epimerase
MLFKETILKGNFVIDLSIKEDERGFFSRYFCKKEFSDYGLNTEWVQINNIFSKELGTLRGLHFQQAPKAEVKLVRCIKGSIWDVVVDLRSDSETFGKWFGATLSEENRTMMYAPKGFAHGFISLEPNTEILYSASDFYEPVFERALIWNDNDIKIYWPIDPIVISDKDNAADTLKKTTPIKL